MLAVRKQIQVCTVHIAYLSRSAVQSQLTCIWPSYLALHGDGESVCLCVSLSVCVYVSEHVDTLHWLVRCIYQRQELVRAQHMTGTMVNVPS